MNGDSFESPILEPSDRPISAQKEDALDRAEFARALAHQIATSPGSEGFVVAVTGPWGSGKSSILNMTIEELLTAYGESVAVVSFNPWFFSGTEELLQSFLKEVGAQLRGGRKIRTRISDALSRYAAILRPVQTLPGVGEVVGPLGRSAEAVGKALRPPDKSLLEQRQEIDQLLGEFGKRIVIVIDDIDRLRPDEIHDLFRLVRLVADFPNTVYLLAFDRRQIEAALSEGAQEGSKYLEKVVQVMHDVPMLRERQLALILANQIDAVLASAKHRLSDQESGDAQNAFTLVVRPLFGSIRDVRRFVHAFRMALELLGGEVSPVDVMSLEAIRVQMPKVFALIPEVAGTLTDTGHGYLSLPGDTVREQRRKQDIQRLLEAAGNKSEVIRQLIVNIFPAAADLVGGGGYGPDFRKRWRRYRRVAHPEVLNLYLEKSLPRAVLSGGDVQELFSALKDEDRLRKLLEELDSDHLETALERMEDYEESFTPVMAGPAMKAILSQWPRLREGRRGMEDFGSEIKVGRVLLRLLRVVPDADRAEVVRSTLRSDLPLSAKLDLAELVGNRENVGHELVDSKTAKSLEADLLREITEAPIERLRAERNLGKLLAWVRDNGSSDSMEFIRTVLADEYAFLRFLRSLLTEQTSQTVGEAAVHTEHKLPWAWISERYGADFLCQQLSRTKSAVTRKTLDEREQLALDAAEEECTKVGENQPLDEQAVASGRRNGFVEGMTYFHLMSSEEVPAKELEGHAPYVTPDEALRAAEKEAQARGIAIHIYRVRDGAAESQPWKSVDPK